MATAASRRDDPGTWAKDLGISKEAVELYLASEVIDLHVDSFIWHRLLGRELVPGALDHARGLIAAAGHPAPMPSLEVPVAGLAGKDSAGRRAA